MKNKLFAEKEMNKLGLYKKEGPEDITDYMANHMKRLIIENKKLKTLLMGTIIIGIGGLISYKIIKCIKTKKGEQKCK